MEANMTHTSRGINKSFSERREGILAIRDEKKRERLCAIWASEHLPSIAYPPKIPEILASRNKRSTPDKTIVDDPQFWQREDVKNYLDKKWSAELKNKDNFDKLHWIKDNLEPTDLEQLVRVRNKLYEYSQFFNTPCKPFRGTEVDFNKYKKGVAK